MPGLRVLVAGAGVEPRLHAQPAPGEAEQGLVADAPPPCGPPHIHGATPAQVSKSKRERAVGLIDLSSAAVVTLLSCKRGLEECGGAVSSVLYSVLNSVLYGVLLIVEEKKEKCKGHLF